MKGKGSKLIILFFIVLITFFSTSSPVWANAMEEQEDLLDIVYDIISYKDYKEKHGDAPRPNKEIRIIGDTFLQDSHGIEALSEYEGKKNVVLTQEEATVTWEVDVPETGMYNLKIEYFPIEGKNNTVEREIYINGDLPFNGAQYLEFSRNWIDESEINQDARGNDIRPKQVEEPKWMETWCKDSSGYEVDAYSFYLEKGINTISLASVKEPLIIGEIIFTQQHEILSYQEYLRAAEALGGTDVVLTEAIKIQGEDAAYKSESVLYPISDRTSPKTEPYHPSKTRLNTIGGKNWNISGQWISWEIEVPKTGFYEIAAKYKQSIKQGVTVVRSLKIDNNIPFKEAQELRFYYENDWQIITLGEPESYKFYLEEGIHTITMEVELGTEMAEILSLADESILELNKAYRQLLMVIGSSPDSLRDYQLEQKTPEALKILGEQFEIISSLANRIEEYTKGSKGSDSAAIDNLIIQLETMHNKPETIAKQWGAFKDNIIALGSWTLSMKEQPLQIDYLLVQSPESDLPQAKANFFEKVWHEIRAFGASFVEDYESIGEVYEGKDTIEVWLLADSATVASASGSGRDQATVLKNMVDNFFVPQTGISANIKLVNRDILLSATLAGEGPDVALNVASKEPVNYALRNAAADLTVFEDFDEVSQWFLKDAVEMFSFNDGVYALPQTTSFQVLFYRADILMELGLQVPETWEEYYECLSVIQKSNMNIGTIPDYTSYGMFLYQHGGQYYSNEKDASGLSSEEAVQAFSQWSGNYADYKMPVTYDFANRFRTGEMPLAIADYSQYSYLSVFAPEIKGLWGFTLVPGQEMKEGVDHSVIASQSASLILNTSKKKEASWEFLKWWMGEETQTAYGMEVENILGVAGRVATANIEALKNLPWTNRDIKQLLAQLAWVKVVPEVPGGYFTERHVKNAFYAVYNGQEDPRETLEDYVKTINNEILNKRIEFGLEESETRSE